MLGKLFGAYITFFIAYMVYVPLRFKYLVRKENTDLASRLCFFGASMPSWLRINDFVQLNKHQSLINPKAISLGETIKAGFSLYALILALMPLIIMAGFLWFGHA